MDKCALALNTVSDFESSVFMKPADCFSYPLPSYRSDMSDFSPLCQDTNQRDWDTCLWCDRCATQLY